MSMSDLSSPNSVSLIAISDADGPLDNDIFLSGNHC